MMTVQVSAGIQWIFGAEFSGIRQGDVQIKVRRTKAALWSREVKAIHMSRELYRAGMYPNVPW